jgi:hypothetical protein
MNNQKFSCKKHSGLNGAYWISVFKTKRSAPRKFLKEHSSIYKTTFKRQHHCRQNHKYLLPKSKSFEEDTLALQNCISDNLL